MKKTRYSIFFLVLLSFADFVLAKDLHKETSDILKNRNHRHLKHEKGKIKHQIKEYDTKCWPQRCNIICPIQLQPFPNVPPVQKPSPAPVPVATAPTSGSTTQPNFLSILFQTTGSPASNQTSNKQVRIAPQLSNSLNQYTRRGIANLLEADKHKDYFKNLTKRQQRILLKQFILGNSNGKKGYKFRQNLPFACFVECAEMPKSPETPLQVPPGSYPSQEGSEPEDSNEDDEDEGIDEPYHEGEDKPIEITISPPDRRNKHNFNDFIFMSGIDGPEIILEDKKKGKSKYHKIN